jgi:hypothetical protein
VCPDRPLLITDWYYIQQMEHISTRGETVWTGPILDAARDFGYTVARFNKGQSGLYRAWRFASLLSESLHMYISGEENAVECLRNPRCVRPEDYTPSIDPAYWYDLSLIPEDQMGTVPVWRVMVITFWGSRPHGYDGMHISAKHHCGQGEGQDWAWHVLGRKFQIAPYAYPDHTHIPITIEKACLDAPKVPPAERENTIAILAKVSSELHLPLPELTR